MEIMKLPQLVKHYFDHEKEEHPGLSFGSFLWEHYVDGEHEDETKGHCDENLPFKHCHDCCTHVVSAIVCLVPITSNEIHYPVSGNEIRFNDEQQFCSFYNCCIWQPPKIA